MYSFGIALAWPWNRKTLRFQAYSRDFFAFPSISMPRRRRSASRSDRHWGKRALADRSAAPNRVDRRHENGRARHLERTKPRQNLERDTLPGSPTRRVLALFKRRNDRRHDNCRAAGVHPAFGRFPIRRSGVANPASAPLPFAGCLGELNPGRGLPKTVLAEYTLPVAEVHPECRSGTCGRCARMRGACQRSAEGMTIRRSGGCQFGVRPLPIRHRNLCHLPIAWVNNRGVEGC
jgi:hypothetical protein